MSEAERFRVLHVTLAYGGGLRTALQRYIAATPHLEHHLLIAGVEEEFPPADVASVRLVGERGRRRAIVERVAELAPDVVHVHSSWAGFFARRGPLSAPVLYQPHGFAFEPGARSGPARAAFRAVERWAARHTDAFAVLTPHEGRLAHGLDASASVVPIENLTDLDVGLHGGWSPPARPRITMVGRVTGQKDPEFFARTIEAARAAGWDAEWTWVGAGDDEPTARLRDLGVDVTGWLDPAGVAEVLRATTVYFHTACYEGFAMSILDAAAVGTPVVARDIACLSDTDLSKVRTPEAAAHVLRGLIENADALTAEAGRSATFHAARRPEQLTQQLDTAYALTVARAR